MQQTNIPFIVVLTKADKLKKKAYAERLAAVFEELNSPKYPVIPFSAVTGQGVDEIQALIANAFEAEED